MVKCITRKLAAVKCNGKEPIMAKLNASNIKSVMGFSYYYYFKACFFAGLFLRAIKPILSECN